MTIMPELLTLGRGYSRANLSELFEQPNLKTSREGLFGRDGENFILFFVTLDKQARDPAVAYNDQFADELFLWESQNNNTLSSKWISKIVEGEVVPLLFVRRIAKIRGITQPFLYAGRLLNPDPDPETSKPVKFMFDPVDLSDPIPASLRPLIDWRPEQGRVDPNATRRTSRSIKKSSTEAHSTRRASDLFPELELDQGRFRQCLDEFRGLMLTRDPYDRGFIAFDDGYARDQEWYKTELRPHALELLRLDDWSEASIGSGTICDHLIAAIEKSDQLIADTNNLLNWQGRQYGPESRDHLKIIQAREDDALCAPVEEALFQLFKNTQIDTAFADFIEVVGRKYALVAFLCWLRDDQLFMPISPRGFDAAFERLGIPLVTSNQCSWDNYRQYNGALGHVANLLTDELREPVRLVDAHSFCWMLARLAAKPPQGRITDVSQAPTNSEELAVYRRLAGSIRSTTRQSGTLVTVTRKPKILLIEDERLEEIIAEKLREQEWRCALTGLPIEIDHPGADPQMVASPDRIDSDGPYSEKNLQVVCRFANFWKSDTPDGEFRRLLEMVRRRDA